MIGQALIAGPAYAQHTSGECPAQTATVSAGGTVTINISDCEAVAGLGGIGDIDGGAFGPADFENHGTATTRHTGGQWFLDYSHNGSTGIGSVDVFELSDGSLAGSGDVRFTITITPSASPLTVTPGSLPTLTAGTPFSQTLTTTGGTGPYSYSLQSGVLPPGVSLSPSGVLSGSPTQRGAYSFSVRATDSTAPTANFVDKGYTGSVQNPSLSLGSNAGTAIQGSPFSQTLTTNGGVAPYAYQIETGSLPSGITLSGAGVLSGTTNAAPGSFPVSIRVTDSSTGPGIYFELETFTLTVTAQPTVSIAVSPASVAEDGSTNLTYTVTRSAASASSLTVNLTTSGTATSGSDYTGAASTIVIPANAASATLTINPTADTISEANETVIVSIASGSGYTVGTPSSATGTINNDEGTSAFCPTLLATVPWGGTVSINAGSCNVGFGLGVVLAQPTHGTASVGAFGPNQPIIYTHNGASGTTDTFTVNDGEAPPNNQIRVNITILPATTSLVVAPVNLSAMVAGTPFTQSLSTTGGVAPYTYVLDSGALPVGLTLSSAGVISGTPTQRGSYAFNVRVTDSTNPTAQSVVKGYSGTVQVPSLALAQSSYSVVQGAAASFTIGVNGGVAPYSFLVEPVPPNALPAGLSLSSTGQITGTPTTSGTFNTTIRVTDSSTGPGSYFELETLTINVTAQPTVSIAVSPASLSEDGTDNLTFTVTRSASLNTPTVVNISTFGTATSGTDYTGGMTNVTIPANATAATIVIDPAADGTVEPDETVTLSVAAGAGYTVGSPSAATGTILNDDVPSASISVAPATVTEDGAGNLVYTVTLSAVSNSPVSINYAVTGTAASGTDYATITSPLIINTGQTTGTITVNPAADTNVEADETVVLTVTAGTGYTVGSPNAATGTISNDDTPGLTINDVTVTEGNSGTTSATFTVSLAAAAPAGGVTFDIATANGTATAGSDYTAQSLSGQTIAAGSTSATFTVSVTGDLLDEPNESFFVNVTNVTNATVVDGQGLGTISDDDDLPTISIGDVGVFEGNSGITNAQLTVSLSAPSGQVVTVSFATGSQTAAQPADYTGIIGTLTFTPGQTAQLINVAVIGDTVPEADETFLVNLSGATNATIADNQGVVTITNDDVPITVSPASLPVGAVGQAYSQSLSASGGTAPYIFAVTSGTLPTGLNLAPSGLLSGVPTAGGSFNVTITATDSSAAPGPFSESRSYTIVVASPTITLPATSLSGGQSGTSYSAALAPATGGTAPFTYTVTGGALPAGLSLSSSGTIAGTPSAFGTFAFTVTATDSSTGTGPYSASQSYTIAILPATPVAGPVSVSLPYGAPQTAVALNLSGGAPTAVSIVTAPSNGVATVDGIGISYRPDPSFSGTDSFTYTATNSGGTSQPATVTVTVAAPNLTVSASGSLTATVGVSYSQTFNFAGGSAPFGSYQVTGLPAGVALTGTTSNSVTIAGVPRAQGTFAVSVSALDSSTGNGPFTASGVFNLNVGAPNLVLTPASGTFDTAYAAAFTRSFTASGGIGGYSYALSGTLPVGLAFDPASGTISGSPTQAGSFPITVTVTDIGATGPGAPFTVSGSYTINVAAPIIVISPGALRGATVGVGYSSTISASGGASPYSFAITGGALPAGMSLAPSGLLSGTPSAGGTFSFTVTATDSNVAPGPFNESRTFTLEVASPTITLPATSLSGGQSGTSYSAALAPASGGTAPFTYTVTGGALPAGLSLSSSGTIAGTPSAFGTFAFTVTATDSSTGNGPYSASQSYTIAILPATPVAGPVSVSLAYGAPQTAVALNLSGGAPTAVSIVSAPSNGTASVDGIGISYRPNPSFSGTDSFTYTATNSGGTSQPATVTVTVAAPNLTVSASGSLTATVGVSYSQTFNFAGGSAPFGSYQVTGLPAGVALTGTTSNSVTIAGVPRAQGTFAVSVSALDSSTGNGPFTASGVFNLNVGAPNLVLDPASGSFDAAYAAPFSRSFAGSGGIGPYSYALAGALPNGMTFNAASGTISGSPIQTGAFPVTITATDTGATGAGAPFTISGSYTLNVTAPTIVVTPGTLPNASSGTAYSARLAASGAVAPYSFSLTGGALPAGLTLSAEGDLAGTPTASGTFALTVTARDANGQASPTNLTLVVDVPVLAIRPETLPAASQGLAYSQRLSATGGVAPYRYAVTTGTLPAGLALDPATGVISGTPTGSGTVNFAITVTDSTTGTAATGTISYALQITARPDPALDPEVRGLVQAQAQSSRRLANSQVNNFMRRLESMRGMRRSGGGFQNGVRLSSPGYCEDSITNWTNEACRNNDQTQQGLAAADRASEPVGGASNSFAGEDEKAWTVWTGGTIRFGDRDAQSGRLSQEFNSEGISIGADYQFSPSFAAGLGVGIGRDETDVGENGSRSEGTAKTIAAYGSHQLGKGIYLEWLGGYQWLDFDLRRYVTSTGALIDSSRSGQQWFATGSLGAEIETGKWVITPYSRLDLVRGKLGGYTENTGSLWDLRFLDQDIDFTSIGLGTIIAYEHRFKRGSLLPRLRAEYLYDLERNADAGVAYRDLVNGPFSTVTLTGFAREQFTFGFGTELLLGSVAFELDYLNRMASGAGSDQAVQVGVSVKY
ncbi:putative Ig domain-containing protein [Porphyrobacter sp. ULC335]|uniref:putative Ig domain-containing protein n=1 Tax=Porphyrobacter sp. ULC335 TaxID=2854260 RepID=UPI0022203AB1|nr:putative Ig domain-containing protein [Porphyrobacter sp. ULC335]UYV16554.1 putative Ig domain-containing protein [Porphyrobacter sp. ULC335]